MNKNIKNILVKILIYVATGFVALFFNVILGNITGFRVGYLIFYLIVFYVAKELCQKWDNRKSVQTDVGKISTVPQTTNSCEKTNYDIKVNKEYAKDKQIEEASINDSNIPKADLIESRLNDMICQRTVDNNYMDVPKKICFCRRCGFKLIDGSEFCSRCGTKIEKEIANEMP